jgi:RNA polymerase sigma factor (sigma-70 family)
MNDKELLPNLFREEYGKIVAVLSKAYGLANIEIAEDVVGDTFLKAAETWGVKGIPENPRAWLYKVAKNRITDILRRNQLFHDKVSPLVSRNIESVELDFSEESIDDSMLRMMFVVCHPSLSSESQVALALRVLCGFSIDEICNALQAKKESINKRLFRAKESLRIHELKLETVSEQDFETNTPSVLSILYLLFNEGYFSTVSTEKIRKDLCFEAMRLLHLITNRTSSSQSGALAMMALFCFQTSRFGARSSPNGGQILYEHQDAAEWDQELIAKGFSYLIKSAVNSGTSRYHLEALIAFWHTQKNVDEGEKWEHILQLYNRLLQKMYSPVTALNRTYALSKVKGSKAALKEALKLNQTNNPLYHALLAKLYQNRDQAKRVEHLRMAIALTKNANDKALLEHALVQANKGSDR